MPIHYIGPVIYTFALSHNMGNSWWISYWPCCLAFHTKVTKWFFHNSVFGKLCLFKDLKKFFGPLYPLKPWRLSHFGRWHKGTIISIITWLHALQEIMNHNLLIEMKSMLISELGHEKHVLFFISTFY